MGTDCKSALTLAKRFSTYLGRHVWFSETLYNTAPSFSRKLTEAKEVTTEKDSCGSRGAWNYDSNKVYFAMDLKLDELAQFVSTHN